MQELSRQTQRYRRSLIQGVLVGFGIGLVFVGGFLFRGFVDTRQISIIPSSQMQTTYPLLDYVQVLLDQHYLRPQPSPQEREYAAIRGVLTALNDKYTFFVDPPVAQSESDVLAGTYGGIGVQIQRNEAGELVLYPFPDSPADKAGLHDGDVLLAVNNSPVDIQIQADVLDQMLRGQVKEGSGVQITVEQGPDKKEFSAFVPFEPINVPSVVWRVLPEDQSIGYIQILLFTSRTPDELQTGLKSLITSGVKALVLDLRNNGGGLLQESVEVSSQFIDGGVVVYEKTNTEEHELDATPGGLATKLPLAVIVNQGTASAAELVAGAIKDRGRGIVIGQTTYGKGSVQQIFRLPDDSSLHITAAAWLTPNRQEIDGKGLQPDMVMIPDVNGRDVELGEATRQLQQLLVQKQELLNG